MKLVLTGDFSMVREKYIEVTEHTKDMNIHARWIYGQHPTDAMIQSYIERQEMYLFMDGNDVAGMVAVTMYQCEDYHEILWSQKLKDDEVASLHILAVIPEYQGKGVSQRMMEEIICLVKKNGKKAIRLDALVSNAPALRMYEKLGFAYRGKQNLFAENSKIYVLQYDESKQYSSCDFRLCYQNTSNGRRCRRGILRIFKNRKKPMRESIIDGYGEFLLLDKTNKPCVA